MIPSKHVPNSIWRSMNLLRNFSHRSLNQFFANGVKLRVGPSTVVRMILNAVLNDQAPTRLSWPPAVTLDSGHQLIEFRAGQYPGLGSHRQCFITPPGRLRDLRRGCHNCSHQLRPLVDGSMPVLYWRLARCPSLQRLPATIRSLNPSIVIAYRLRLTRLHRPVCMYDSPPTAEKSNSFSESGYYKSELHCSAKVLNPASLLMRPIVKQSVMG